TDPLVREALRRIGEHLADAFGPAQLAESVGVSRGTLDRRFAAELGRSASVEIRRRRLSLARRLLRETGLSVVEIAARAGFSSASHLGTAIREATGLTPSGWRKSDISTVKI
ncbi:MAG: helix-turn-helix transcriptional regulator, partial [Kiritimatiellae bacterium]|nr:helix-turn-helix transcriptional regulator [Kiritimatiellia bacterium]